MYGVTFALWCFARWWSLSTVYLACCASVTDRATQDRWCWAIHFMDYSCVSMIEKRGIKRNKKDIGKEYLHDANYQQPLCAAILPRWQPLNHRRPHRVAKMPRAAIISGNTRKQHATGKICCSSALRHTLRSMDHRLDGAWHSPNKIIC